MQNPIPLIKKLYQLPPDDKGISPDSIEAEEKRLGIRLPAGLYHYCHELGNAKAVNQSGNQLVVLPLTLHAEHLLIARACDDDGVWGIHVDALSQYDPMVRMSRNYDAIEISEVHWFDERPLSAFLLAQAIYNGVTGGLNHHAQLYDFAGDTLPQDLLERIAMQAESIEALSQSHERYYQAADFAVVIVVSLGDDGEPTAFMLGSQSQSLFEAQINRLIAD